MRCDKCGSDSMSFVVRPVEQQVWCRDCHTEATIAANPSHLVVGDEIDVYIKHGMCWPDGTPRRWRSRKELNEAAAKAGMVNTVRTRTTPGPNPHRKVFGMFGHTKGSTQT